MTNPQRPGTAPPRSLKGYLLLGLAFLTCPCHVPILLAVLAGTGLASILSQYLGVAVVTLTVIFIGSLVLGLRALKPSAEGRK